jgi:hypothetical protein
MIFFLFDISKVEFCIFSDFKVYLKALNSYFSAKQQTHEKNNITLIPSNKLSRM